MIYLNLILLYLLKAYLISLLSVSFKSFKKGTEISPSDLLLFKCSTFHMLSVMFFEPLMILELYIDDS